MSNDPTFDAFMLTLSDIEIRKQLKAKTEECERLQQQHDGMRSLLADNEKVYLETVDKLDSMRAYMLALVQMFGKWKKNDE